MAALTPNLPGPPPGLRAPKAAPGASRSGFVPRSIEDQVRFSYPNPTPQAYYPYDPHKPDITEPKSLGKISASSHPKPLEYAAKHRAYVPGPGSYDTPGLSEFALPEGGRVSRVAPPQRMQLDEYPIPAPGQYGIPNDPTAPALTKGRFGKDPRVTAFIKEQEMLSRGIPAPGTHEVLESMEMTKPFCPEGGRYLDANRPPSYFEMAPKLSASNPPPGSYEVKGALEDKTVGRVVYRYESATMEETKALHTKVTGGSNETPGPGTYELPVTKPIGGVPAQKGRMLPYAMPHPFAYNCAVDHTRSFLEPVRQRNNADQIFGNGLRPGSQRRGKNRAQSETRFEQGDQLAELPFGVGDEEKPPAEDEVQWRSGGFSSLKKSRSVTAVRADIDDVVAQGVGKSYPPLQRKKRSNSTFLPMSSRRTEKIKTYGASQESQRLGHSKWKLSKVCEGIQNAAAAAMEPLDVDKLKRDAMTGLRDKALTRMKLQGVSRGQQEVILEEMNALLQEKSYQEWSSAADEFDQDPALGPQSMADFVNAEERRGGDDGLVRPPEDGYGDPP
eukprot:TRINITY_DN6327_c0_g2_i1.p1 TRINITY_DN6327_c0_g2~~TRINITY_DN6327_c0_g2_i1.p1  ORF type:complete len:558 (+),score=100.31 TRINITY_DN6327_c0_g2_i1:61-1734(+)